LRRQGDPTRRTRRAASDTLAVIKAVIFDIDGTLVDSVDFHAEAWQRAFAKFGKEIPFEKIRAQIGKGGDQLLPVFWSEEELARIKEPLTEYRTDLYHKEYLPRVKGFPKVRELFEQLLAHGKQVALASSANGDELGTYKKIAGIEDLVDTATSSDDAEKSKPHPDIFVAAREKLGNPPAGDCIIVGDTPYDIEAAAKAGMRTIAVRCGGFPEETLRGAVAIYDGPADLLTRYEESPLAGG
jgi:HAD superfamily hydrolase (TIGR01509 family)